ncbi:MAG: DNA mismatch repair endonuclease MutL [Thermodesulfobacteriota bacterium]
MKSQESRINILPEDLQNQIAAGEVVERPASVLKELVENSLDAGADRIHAEIEGGGQNRILVQDNGYGLNADELPLALNRHATSKIHNITDLSRISSFGFRGEALPSIASVSKLEIASIPRDGKEGSQLTVEFGNIRDQHPVSLREGTRIQVRDLFITTPARLKFLKTTPTEAKRCQEVLKRFALCNLEVQFKLVSNNKDVFNFPGKQGLIERLSRIWPPAVTGNLYTFSRNHEDLSISGAVSDPVSTQPKPDRIYFFVNNRPVHDKLLLKALREAYKGRLLSREYPQAVLFLHIPSEEVDINVHPAKSEIRFRNEGAIFSLVKKGVEQALEQGGQDTGLQQDKPAPPSISPDWAPQQEQAFRASSFQTFEEHNPEAFREERKDFARGDSHVPPPGAEQRHSGNQLSATRVESREQAYSDLEKEKGYFYLGQIQATYLLLSEKGNNLLILDQHAVHERILFHRFSNRMKEVGSQLLALPGEYQLHASEKKQLQDKANYLRQLGYSFQLSGGEILQIQAIPDFFSFHEAREFLESILSAKVESMQDIWTLMACRKAIKAGEELSGEEALNLLESWLQTPDRFYCPHGRPAAVRLSSRELENFFKRS